MKVETCRPVYILFNVYEINYCVIDWHICVFYICQNTSGWQTLNLNLVSLLNIAYNSVHAVKSYSSLIMSVKMICVPPFTFLLLCASSSNRSYLYVISLSKPDQVPPTFLPSFLLHMHVFPKLLLLSWTVWCHDILIYWDQGHFNVACPNLCHVPWNSRWTKVPCTLGWPYTEGTWLYCDYFIRVYLVLWLF